jgi:pimeloyl-ACP methyl ester carboxylesterase
MSYLNNFNFQVSGLATSPRKLVFLHGLMGYAANWRRIAKAFEGEFQVLVYDQRGHGRSFRPETGYSPGDYAEDLLKIIDELQWPKIDLVGHSMGGRAAFYFASKYPDRLNHLIIEDIGPSDRSTGASLAMQMLDAVPAPFATKRAAKDWFDTEFFKVFADQPRKEGLAAYLYANLKEDENQRAVWRFFEPGIRESVEKGRDANLLWNIIASLDVPTLLIRGEHSKDLPRETYDRILRTNSRIKGEEIAGAGHWVHSDQPEKFIETLRDFVFVHGSLTRNP